MDGFDVTLCEQVMEPLDFDSPNGTSSKTSAHLEQIAEAFVLLMAKPFDGLIAGRQILT